MICHQRLYQPGTVMNRALNIGVMLALFVHMVLGCCRHHAHGSENEANVPVVSGSCACEHAGHEDHDQPRDNEGQPRKCNGGQCSFTLPQSSDNTTHMALQGLPAILWPPLLPVLKGVEAADLTAGSPGSPIPLHLLNQAFLL